MPWVIGCSGCCGSAPIELLLGVAALFELDYVDLAPVGLDLLDDLMDAEDVAMDVSRVERRLWACSSLYEAFFYLWTNSVANGTTAGGAAAGRVGVMDTELERDAGPAR